MLLQYCANDIDVESLCLPADVEVSLVRADFKNPESMNDFCRLIPETDLLINNAAAIHTDLLPQLDDASIDEMIAVNLSAFVRICRAAIPYMMSKRKGNIINISSISAQRVNRGQSVYAGTKAFVEVFSRGLAVEFGSRGIRVNCVAPGPIESASMKSIMSYAPDEIISSMVSKRFGRPEDVASVVAFLASDESEFINGETIRTDGGFLRGL